MEAQYISGDPPGVNDSTRARSHASFRLRQRPSPRSPERIRIRQNDGHSSAQGSPAMMQQLRESTKVIMVIVAVSFVGLMVFEWGMDLSGRSSQQGGGTSLGSVDGTDISVEDYQRQYQILYEQAQSQSPEGLSREQLEQIEQQAWDDVVNLTLLRHEARERGIRVTDSELVEYIKYNPPSDIVSMPAFQTGGQFDIAKYQAALADPALQQTWIEYETQLRGTLPIQKLQEQVVAGTVVTDAEARATYRDRFPVPGSRGPGRRGRVGRR
jgi:hypothetical protein